MNKMIFLFINVIITSIGGDFFMRPRLVRYYGPDYDNLKHGYVYQVHCLYSHGFMLIDDHHEQAYVYAGNCEVL